jgi:DNA-binding SARP family transcriptional activator
MQGSNRLAVLQAISEHATEKTAELLRSTDGADVQELRRDLVQRFAKPLLVRTFGTLAIHRGSWSSAEISIGRRRTRLLLGLLVANFDSGLTRDQVIDLLWPDADPSAAVNSLNQTVFQLRRIFEPGYREGDHPQYLISTLDVVQLNRDLVATDLMEIRHLRRALDEPHDVASRATLAHQLVDLARGEYLADLRYEDWVATNQLGVHSEVRAALLPIAQGACIGPTDEWALKAGCALAAIDPFDESAHVAMIRHLAATGRRIQARSLASDFSTRLRREFDEEPSDELRLAASMVGADLGSNQS